MSGDSLGRSCADDGAAAGTAFGADVDHPVGRLDDVDAVFNDQDCVAVFDEAVQHFEQLFDVCKVQPSGRFVEQVNRLPGRSFAEFSCQFDPLRLATGKSGRWLSQLEIVETDVVQRLQQFVNLRDVFEMLERFLDVHVEDFGDVLSFETNFQRLVMKTLSVAHRTGHPDVGQEVHFELVGTVTFAGFAAAATHVEAESPRLVAANFCFRQLCVEVTNQVEQFDVRCRVGPRCASDRRLIDVDGFVDMLDAGDRFVIARLAFALIDVSIERLPENVVDQ